MPCCTPLPSLQPLQRGTDGCQLVRRHRFPQLAGLAQNERHRLLPPHHRHPPRSRVPPGRQDRLRAPVMLPARLRERWCQHEQCGRVLGHEQSGSGFRLRHIASDDGGNPTPLQCTVTPTLLVL